MDEQDLQDGYWEGIGEYFSHECTQMNTNGGGLLVPILFILFILVIFSRAEIIMRMISSTP